MKMKRLIAMAVTGLLAIGTTGTAFAATGPYLWYGTEKTYGEAATQHKDLWESEETFSGRYAILPKNDTFSFENRGSDIDPSHNVEITWNCPNSFDGDEGKVGLLLEGWLPPKTEKFEFGKEYPVYPDEVKARIDEMNNMGGLIQYVNDPFVIIKVHDYDLDWTWWWMVQVTDNWVAPTGSNNGTQQWASNDKGWWVVNPDGSYLTNTWYQSGASGKWYYMGSNGYMLVNTTTPDGYAVGEDGAWVQ